MLHMFPNKRQRQSPRKRLDLGTALEKDRSVSEGKKAKRQLFQSRRSEAGPSTSSQNTVIDHELRTDTRTLDNVKLNGIHLDRFVEHKFSSVVCVWTLQLIQ